MVISPRKGQSVTEFILATAILTGIGILIMDLMMGPKRNNGAIQDVANNSKNVITNDRDY